MITEIKVLIQQSMTFVLIKFLQFCASEQKK